MKKIKNFINSLNLKNIKPHTYVSVIMVILVIVNQILTAMGKPIINLGEDTITYWVNTTINIIAILYPAWKNNSFTDMAQYADDILMAMRDGKITKEELEDFINKNKTKEQ